MDTLSVESEPDSELDSQSEFKSDLKSSLESESKSKAIFLVFPWFYGSVGYIHIIVSMHHALRF